MRLYEKKDMVEDPFNDHGIAMQSITTGYYQLANELKISDFMYVTNLIKTVESNATSLLFLPFQPECNDQLINKVKESLLEAVKNIILISEDALRHCKEKNIKNKVN